MTIKTEEPRLGVSEQILNAQLIVDAYSRGLQDSQCLSRVPISIYSEADEYENRLQSMVEQLGGTLDIEESRENTYVYIRPGLVDAPAPNYRPSPLSEAVKNKAIDDCVGCDFPPLPKFDLGSLFGDLMKRVEDFIEDIKRIFGKVRVDVCQFAYFLSFMCLPDLIKLLALILAYILKLIAAIVLGSFSLLAFLMGIVTSIIGAVLKFALAMLEFVMTPVTCILESIGSILESIPDEGNLRRELSSEEYELLFSQPKPEGEVESKFTSASKESKKERDKANNTIKAQFESMTSRIEESVDGVQSTIDDLLGLTSFLECESDRSGISIMDKLEAIVDLVSIAALLRSVIKQKSAKSAYNELCRAKNRPDKARAEEFTPDDIAKVIEDTFRGQADIIESSDGDIAILFKPPKTSVVDDSNISIFSCNFKEFIEDNHLDKVVEEAIVLANAELIGEGNNPRIIRNRVPIKEANVQDRDKVLFLPNKNGNSAQVEIADIISTIAGYRPLTGKSARNIDSDIIERAVREYKAKVDTLPDKEDRPIMLPTQNEPEQSSTENMGTRQVAGQTVIGATYLNKPINLKCGSIKGLQDRLNLLDE